MGERRRGRERALQCLYQWESTSSRATLDRILARFWKARSATPEVHRFAERLVRGTVARIDDIDPLIAEQATNWRLDRMSSVDRNILRLGVYEMLAESETPAAVVIDEAIELAKRYSGEQAGQFVNGVLDGIRERLEEQDNEGGPVDAGEAEAVGDGNEATG